MGTLYIISAPSGCGKTSLIHSLVAALDQLALSISHTTRQARATEVPGVHYHFVSVKDFQRMVQQDRFLEHAKILGDYYGTSSNSIETTLRSGVDVILEIDWQGAQQIAMRYKKAVSIFIRPPSIDSLRERLLKRAEDSLSSIEARLKQAPFEIAQYQKYDYLVTNAEFQQALSDLERIIKAQRLRNPSTF